MITRTYNLTNVLNLKEKLFSHATLQGYLGQQLTGSTFRNFVKDCRRLLPGKPQEQVIQDSLLHLAGVHLDEDLLDENAWRLAGNMNRINAWRPAVPWNRQVDHEYVPVQVVAAERSFLKNKQAVELEFKVLAGTPTTMSIYKLWSLRFCGALSRRLGFSRANGDYPFDDALQFVSLRMYVLIDPKISGSGPDFEEIWQEDRGHKIRPSSVYNYNRKIMRMRAGQKYKCPKGFDVAEHPCHLCEIGQDECPVAVHDLTYLKKECPKCKLPNAFFDPAVKRKVCVNCHYKLMKERSK